MSSATDATRPNRSRLTEQDRRIMASVQRTLASLGNVFAPNEKLVFSMRDKKIITDSVANMQSALRGIAKNA